MFRRVQLSIQVWHFKHYASVNRWYWRIHHLCHLPLGQTRTRNSSASGAASNDSSYSNKGGSFLQRISNRFSKRWVSLSSSFPSVAFIPKLSYVITPWQALLNTFLVTTQTHSSEMCTLPEFSRGWGCPSFRLGKASSCWGSWLFTELQSSFAVCFYSFVA